MSEEESPQPEPTQNDVKYERSRHEAKRAQLALNILVIFSAVAGSVFFFYVLYTIQPFGGKEPPEVNVPTSKVGERLGVLGAYDEDTGLSVLLRDIDEAPSYRKELSEVMRRDMGIKKNGRVYLLVIQNGNASEVEVACEKLMTTDKKDRSWTIRWIPQVAEKSSATAVGRMRITQSAYRFTLGPGQERQLYVFVESGGGSLPPSAEDFVKGTLSLGAGVQISLLHEDVRVADK